MKLRDKMYIYQAIIVSALTIAIINFIYPNPLFFSIICLLLISLLAFLSSQYFSFKRIDKLAKKIAHLIKDPLIIQDLRDKKADEISHLANTLNQVVDSFQATFKQYIQKNADLSERLQRSNIFLQREISQRTHVEMELTDHREYLSRVARYDTLTSLPNRVVFNEILNKSISHAKRRNKISAILLINIDNFQKIKSTLPADNADHILKEIGKRFEDLLRAEDILAKLDGDEFIILINDINQAKFASAVADKLLQSFKQPYVLDEQQFYIAASIGICILPTDGDSLEVLLKNVNLALYKAKHAGGNCYQFFEQEMDNEARQYIDLSSALRQAVANKELVLYYQPKLDLKKSKIVGLEALLRWDHPQYGLIMPDKFLNVAEESGAIMQIGAWALQEACRMNKHWQNSGYEHMTVSLNLSAKQFFHPEMPQIIANALRATELHPKYLELEINAQIIMDNSEQALTILNAFKATGVQLAIDHFGTGNISLQHLKRFPLNTLKIDRSFIRGIPANPDDSAITCATIALAHSLGLVVIAEGVEVAEQVEFLAKQNCDLIQGYFLSHPLPEDKIAGQFNQLSNEIIM